MSAGVMAGDASDDELAPNKEPWIVAQEKGLVKGAFNPWKRGLNLPPNPKIMVIPLSDAESTKYGMVDEWQSFFVERRLKAAEAQKFDLVILQIDTHGGVLSATEKIIADVAACKVPVVAYVQRALSAGAFIAMGCKLIIMDPNAHIGSAKVINGTGDFDIAMRQKEDGYMRAMVRGLSDRNGYPAAIAQGMVDSAIEVIETSDSQQRFMTDAEFGTAQRRGVSAVKTWKKKDEILALNAAEAVSAGLAQGIASNTFELQLGLAIPAATVTRMDTSSAEVAARFLSHPLWRVVIVIVGLIGLFLELKSPGHGVGFATFAFCMGIFFWLQVFSHNAGIVEICVFGAGALLVAVELFVLPTFGTLGFLGVVMVIFSIVAAYLPEGSLPGLLGFSGKPPEYVMERVVSGMQWASLTLVSIILFFSLVWWRGIKLPGFGRLELHAVNAGTIDSRDSPPSGAFAAPLDALNLEVLVGRTAMTDTILRPSGKVKLDEKTYDAVSDGEFVEAGREVEILRVTSGNLVVRSLQARPADKG